MLLGQVRPSVEIEYGRVVRRSGNATARAAMRKVFEEADSEWRGLGMIRSSGLRIKKEFRRFDAVKKFGIKMSDVSAKNVSCVCADILKGAKMPDECPLFGKSCTPDSPKGACMVSGEGACAARFRYGR
jgi:hydrogenase expression/formation protein HypD